MAKLANTPIGVNTKVKLIRIHNLLYNIIHSGAYSTLLHETNFKNNIDSYKAHHYKMHYKCTTTLNHMNRMSKHKWNKGVTQEVLTKLNVLWNKIGADFKEPEFDYLFAPPGRDVTKC